MILAHEYPFAMMEHEFFNLFMLTTTPYYQKISRATSRNDIMAVSLTEKKSLKEVLKGASKVSITSDFWKSGQLIGYMCVTTHFIDFNTDWKLQKRVISFCGVPPLHTGKIFHVRCCAHIINLLVQDGLSEVKGTIENVRESVKYIKASEARLLKFSKIKKQLRLPHKKLIIDVSTRCNSTYAMLESALQFKSVFLAIRKGILCMNNRLPSESDWEIAKKVCQLLEIFKEVTDNISGRDYPTSNLFLPVVWKIKEVLDTSSDELLGENRYIQAMALKMKAKFDKYWGECNLLMALATVLDPRYKMVLINFCFPKIYPQLEGFKKCHLSS